MNFKDVDFEGLRSWQQKGPRSVKIEFGQYDDNNYVDVWVYDYSLMVGQRLVTGKVSEIDLIEIKRKELQSAIDQLNKLDENSEN